MESIKISFQLEYEDVKKVYSFGSEAGSNSFAGLVGKFLVVIFGIALATSVYVNDEKTKLGLLSAFLFFIMVVAVSYLYSRYKLKKLWQTNSTFRSPISYEFLDSEIHIKSLYQNANVLWDAFSKVLENDEYFLMFYPNNTFMAIPKRSFVDPSQIEIFKQLLKEKIKGKVIFFENHKSIPKRSLFSKPKDENKLI